MFFNPVVLYEIDLICIFMNISENLKLKNEGKTLDELVSQEVIRPTLNTEDIFLWNNNKKFRSFESKENIHKKEVGTYHAFGY